MGENVDYIEGGHELFRIQGRIDKQVLKTRSSYGKNNRNHHNKALHLDYR